MPHLPKEILDRIERVIQFHQSTKIGRDAPAPAPVSDPAYVASVFRVFGQFPEIKLPTTLLDAPTPVLTLLQQGRDALPESHVVPPQDLKTLATWLFLADGMIPVKRKNRIISWLRTCPSVEGTLPFEIYVAAFAIDGLTPGLYHYQPREFSLRKLRDGAAALGLLRRGRPDLDFIRNAPGALLISTVFSRTTARFGRRGYRAALLDSGHLIENVAVAGNSLGIQTLTRLRITESNTRELIGLPVDADFAQAESVQGMVIWADPARHPQPLESQQPRTPLPPIERSALAQKVDVYDLVLSAHEDCVAPGVGFGDVRPPFTEAYPLPPTIKLITKNLSRELPEGRGLFRVLANRRVAPAFVPKPISRDPFLQINLAAFRGGSYYPLYPEGPYVALARPYWLINDVSGMEQGVWYYHPPADRWTLLAQGNIRRPVTNLALGSPLVEAAAAVCVIVANLGELLHRAGPDIYRLAHLEAGVAAHRIHLAANALDLGCRVNMNYLDNELKRSLGLEGTAWEPLCMLSLGVSVDDAFAPDHLPQSTRIESAGDWRD